MPTVNIPNVGAVRFDDSMSPDEIKTAIERDILPSRSAKPVAPPPPPRDPTEGMGEVQKGLAGMGKSFSDTGVGGQQVALRGMAAFFVTHGLQVPSWIQDKLQGLSEDTDVAKKRDAPLMNTGAGLAGNMLGQLALSAVAPIGGAATGLGRIGLAGAVGAGQGMLQPTGTGETPVANTLLGGAAGALGQGAANVVGAGFRGMASSPQAQAAADWLRSQGSKVSVGQATGNEMMQRVESWLAKLPGTRGWYSNLDASQKSAVDRAIGAMTKEGNPFEGVAAASEGKMFTSDQPFVDELRSLPGRVDMLAGGLQPNSALRTAQAYAGTGAPPMATGTAMIGGRAIDVSKNPQLARAVAEAQQAASGEVAAKLPVGAQIPLTGPHGDYNNYQAIRSVIGKEAFKAGPGTAEGDTLKAIRNAFDDAAERSLTAQGADPALMQDARNAYQVSKTLQPAARQTAEEGTITYSAQQAANIIDKAFTKGTLSNLPQETQDTLRSVMNAARAIKPVSSSGTAENQLAKGIATLGILGGIGGEYAMGDKVGHAPAAMAGLIAAPWLVNRGMQTFGTGLVPKLAAALPDEVTLALRQLASVVPATAVTTSR